MLSLESYRRSWERKIQWYKENGYMKQLIISQDGPDGSIDSKTIDRIIEEKLSVGKQQKESASKRTVGGRVKKTKQNRNQRSHGAKVRSRKFVQKRHKHH